MKDEKYKANFLWPYEYDSIEALGYEFANAKTEEYREEVWGEIIKWIDLHKNEKQQTNNCYTAAGKKKLL